MGANKTFFGRLISNATQRVRLEGNSSLAKQLACLTVIAWTASPTFAQQTDSLEQQLQQLKQQYEQTTRDLQQRIAALEAEIAKEKEKETSTKPKEGTVSAVELAAQEATKKAAGNESDVGAKFQGQLSSEPTYDFLREADQEIAQLKQQVNSFEFHGYFRSGYGLNGDGGQQV